jgi:hypothetical protein
MTRRFGNVHNKSLLILFSVVHIAKTNNNISDMFTIMLFHTSTPLTLFLTFLRPPFLQLFTMYMEQIQPNLSLLLNLILVSP